MDITRITPFIQSVHHVFEMMLQLPVEVGEPRLMDASAAPHDVAARAGVTGSCEGSVALGFDHETAERIVALFTGSEMSIESPDFADAVGELFDMICGAAKAWLPGHDLCLSIPVVELEAHPMAVPVRNGAPVITIPCATECGPLVIELSLEDPVEAATRGARAVCAGA